MEIIKDEITIGFINKCNMKYDNFYNYHNTIFINGDKQIIFEKNLCKKSL